MGDIFKEKHPSGQYIRHFVSVAWAAKNYCVDCKRNRVVKGALGSSVDSKSHSLEVPDHVEISVEDRIFQVLDFLLEVLSAIRQGLGEIFGPKMEFTT